MSRIAAIWRDLFGSVKSAESALRSIIKEIVHRLRTYFREWPEQYIEMRASLYENHR